MSKPYDQYKKQDPFYTRECEKYDQPIPSREFILKYLEDYGRPISKKQLIDAFKLKGEEQQEIDVAIVDMQHAAPEWLNPAHAPSDWQHRQHLLVEIR